VTGSRPRSTRVHLDVPRFPQQFGEGDWPAGTTVRGHGARHWGGRACGVACLRMLLAYYGLPVPSLFDLLVEAVERDAYTPRGWLHSGLVDLARRHGMRAAARPVAVSEFAGLLRASGPLIVSVGHRFPVDGSRGGHLVVVNGQRRAAGETRLDVRDPAPFGARRRSVPLARLAASYSGRGIVFCGALTGP
jgi:ABC-type bacteriocin/lantibiotic exporter with double-glycine peptidase domain